MIIGVLTALALAQAEPAAAAAAVSLEDELRRARNEYAFGNYQQAADQLHALLYPMRLSTDAQVIEARKYLALAYYLLNRQTHAREEFAKLLYLDPDYELDPFSVAPPLIEAFEAVRRDLKQELSSIRQRQSEAQLGPPHAGLVRVVKTRYVERANALTFMPFGVGQLQNGDLGWGVFFGITEMALLAVNIGAYLGVLSFRDYGAADRSKVQALMVTQYASLALFGSLWSIGVVQARLHFVPGINLPPEIHEEAFEAPAGARGLALVGTF